jgi:NTP pyrophosphatase (non-canonical NTP hydrolase)
MDFNEFRDQVRGWSDYNFGHNKDRHHRPLLGMVEELKELLEAYEKFNSARPRSNSHPALEDVKDAIADIVVFGADYAARKEWDYEALSQTKVPWIVDADGVIRELTKGLGAMCHHQLKTEQGIRGNAEEHSAKAQQAMGHVLGYLNVLCQLHAWAFRDLVMQVWSRVRQRDFTKNKLNGDVEGANAT